MTYNIFSSKAPSIKSQIGAKTPRFSSKKALKTDAIASFFGVFSAVLSFKEKRRK